MSVRKFAQAIGVAPSHLSRVMHRKAYKTASIDLCMKTSRFLGLPDDFFPEVREHAVIERIKTDHQYRDRLYDRL